MNKMIIWCFMLFFVWLGVLSINKNLSHASEEELLDDASAENIGEEVIEMEDWRTKPPFVDENGVTWRLNPIDDSESWIPDPNQDLNNLEAIYNERLSIEKSEMSKLGKLKGWHESEVIKEFALRTGGLPQMRDINYKMKLMSFNTPPLHLSVDNSKSKTVVHEDMTVAALGSIESIVQSACVKDDISYNGYSRINPTGKRARTVLIPYSNGFRVDDERLQINWRLGFDDQWYMINSAFDTPCIKRNYEKVQEENFSSKEDLNNSAMLSLSEAFGIEIKDVMLVNGLEARWTCQDDMCVLTRSHRIELPSGSIDPQKVVFMCQSGVVFSEEEPAFVIASLAYEDDSMISCYFSPVNQGNSSGKIRVEYAEPYSINPVTTDAWYGTITDSVGNPREALDASGEYQNVTANPAMYNPAPTPTLHDQEGFPKRTYHISPDPNEPPTGDWGLPFFIPGGTTTYQLSNAGLDHYDRTRIMGHTWVEWGIQLTVDTTENFKDVQTINGEPIAPMGIRIGQGGLGSISGYPWAILIDGGVTKKDENGNIIPHPWTAGPVDGENGDSHAIGHILHEFSHTLQNTWRQNISGTTWIDCNGDGKNDNCYDQIANESEADTYAAIYTKGQNYRGGRYTSFYAIEKYPYFPGGDLNTSECTKMGRLLSAINYQLNVLGHQIGWDGLTYGLFTKNNALINDYSITGWAETGTIQEVFGTLYNVSATKPAANERTFLDFVEENLLSSGLARYRPIVYNHFNRTTTYDYETPNYDRDGVGNLKKFSKFIVWPSNFASTVSFDTKPSGFGDLSLSPGTGEEEDYDYYQFYAPSGVQFDIHIDTTPFSHYGLQLELFNESGHCIYGLGADCDSIGPYCGSNEVCIIDWISSSSQMYYFRVYNTYTPYDSYDISYTVTMNRDGDKEGDNAWGSEPTYLQEDAYIVGRLDGSSDVDFFRIVVPDNSWFINAYTCEEGSDTPGLSLTLYDSKWESSRLTQDQILATSTTSGSCGANNASISYIQAVPPGVYFLKVSYKGTGNTTGNYRLHVNVFDSSTFTGIVDEGNNGIILDTQTTSGIMESLQSNTSGKFTMIRGHLSSNTGATDMCKQPYPVVAAISSPCADNADFYRIYLEEGQYVNVGTRGHVEVSIWALNTIHDARSCPDNCTDVEGVGCAPLVRDNRHAVDDGSFMWTASGEITFVAPIAGDYEIRIVQEPLIFGTETNYTMFVHKQPANLDWTRTEPLKFPSTY